MKSSFILIVYFSKSVCKVMFVIASTSILLIFFVSFVIGFYWQHASLVQKFVDRKIDGLLIFQIDVFVLEDVSSSCIQD